MIPPEHSINGPDDFLARHGDAALLAVIDRAVSADPATTHKEATGESQATRLIKLVRESRVELFHHDEETGKNSPLQDAPATRLTDPYNPAASLDARARSYLHVNCAHCHQFGAGGTADIELRHTVALDRMKLSPEERQAKVEEQKRINDAIVRGNLSQLPANVRRAVDNGEVQSLFTVDPEKLMKEVRQPILIVQGELDAEVEPKNADLLEALAKKRKNGAVEVVKAAGVNHLLTPATTGAADEYSTLRDRHVAA